MAGFFDRYATDRNLEEDGVEVDFGDGLVVTLRRLNSKKSREYRRKIEKPFASQFRGREIPDSVQEDLLNNQIANVIIVDWKGIPNPDNPSEQLPYSPENALRMIKDYPDFRDDILTAAMEKTTFQKVDLEAQEKN